MRLSYIPQLFREHRERNSFEVSVALTIQDLRKMFLKKYKRDDKIPMPWDELTLEKRLTFFKKDKKNIVYIYSKPDYNVFRYRVYNLFQAINNHLPEYSATFFFEHEIDKALENIDLIDKLVFVRIGWSSSIDRLLKAAQKKGVKIGFDIDDLVFEPHKLPLLLSHIEVPENEHSYWLENCARLNYMIDEVDFFTTTTTFLKNEINKYQTKKKSVFIIHNSLNQLQLEASENALKNLEKNENKFVIGYFSGSKTHDKDFELVEDSLVKILEKYKHVSLKLAGKLSLPESLAKFTERIERVGFTDFLTLQKTISTCDLNIVPLVINDFTNGKSELKYFDAAIVKVPTIASNTQTFQEVIKNEVDGIVCSENDWFINISNLIENPSLLRNITENAYQKAIQNYTPQKIAEEIKTIMNNL